ncbi:MAG: GNAT family N-acetyltransferase, partial [Dermatophilaceae bacterium]
LGYRRVEWKCDSMNEPSRRAAIRLGFTVEGTFRHHMVTRGRTRDTTWFSVTDREWRTLRAVHERWLAPDNIADDGGQRRALGALTAAWRASSESR